jgi:hypothetical protein
MYVTAPLNQKVSFQFSGKNSINLHSVNFKPIHDKIIFYISGEMDDTSKLSNRSEKIKREKLQFSFVVGKNSQPSMERGQKYFYIDSAKYVSSFKKHHILPCPQQDSINYIYSDNSLHYMKFTDNRNFCENQEIKKNIQFKKIIWNKFCFNKLIGLTIENTVHLIDIIKPSEEISFNFEDETITDILHVETGDFKDMIICSTNNDIVAIDERM